MSKEKQNEEIVELSSIIGCAVNDWGDFCEDCHKDGYSPTDTLEEYVAVSVLTKGYRKQSEPISCGHEKGGEWISVSERLPDEELQELRSNDPEMTFRCLTARMSEDNHGETYVYQAFYDEKRGKKRFVNGNGVDITASVAHWRPLPEPPKGV